jgi:chromosome segregation ATPase
MTIAEWQTIFSAGGLIIAITAMIITIRKAPGEMRINDASLTKKYQEMFDDATSQIEVLRNNQARMELDFNTRFNILKGELESEKKRADDYQQKAEKAEAENAQLIRRVSALEATLKKISEWGKKWSPQLNAAGIEPMPTE